MFKVEKVSIDLELDLTAFIPGEDGKIDSNKKTVTDIEAWLKWQAKKADELIKIGKESDNETMIEESREKLIDQVDWLYEKGADYWRVIPRSVMEGIVTFIREEMNDSRKKFRGSKK
jgi:hypothetical protein